MELLTLTKMKYWRVYQLTTGGRLTLLSRITYATTSLMFKTKNLSNTFLRCVNHNFSTASIVSTSNWSDEFFSTKRKYISLIVETQSIGWGSDRLVPKSRFAPSSATSRTFYSRSVEFFVTATPRSIFAQPGPRHSTFHDHMRRGHVHHIGLTRACAYNVGDTRDRSQAYVAYDLSCRDYLFCFRWEKQRELVIINSFVFNLY